uniref:Uncharacterized protein n=1 Tax=Amphimedon queenslandica TaxID=400682 RepID=A0A1X7U8Q0_AMPQE
MAQIAKIRGNSSNNKSEYKLLQKISAINNNNILIINNYDCQ